MSCLITFGPRHKVQVSLQSYDKVPAGLSPNFTPTRRFALLVVLVLLPRLSGAWGREDHRIIASIAEAHLSATAKKNLHQYLGE